MCPFRNLTLTGPKRYVYTTENIRSFLSCNDVLFCKPQGTCPTTTTRNYVNQGFGKGKYLWFTATVRLPLNKQGSICFQNSQVIITASGPLSSAYPWGSPTPVFNVTIPDGCVYANSTTQVATTVYDTSLSPKPTWRTYVSYLCFQTDTFITGGAFQVFHNIQLRERGRLTSSHRCMHT